MLVYLGVFMLLLAFFILLNAVSHFHEQKVGAVLRSVDQAFSMPRLLSGNRGEKAHDLAMGDALQAIASLGDQMRSEVPLSKVDTSVDGLTLSVTMPGTACSALMGRYGLIVWRCWTVSPARFCPAGRVCRWRGIC